MYEDREKQDLVQIRLGMGEQVIRHHQSPQVAYGIPLGQAAIWGVLLAVFATVLSIIFLPSFWWQIFAITFTACMLVVWAVGYFRWVSWGKRVYHIEEFLGLDLNRDSYIGEPEPAKVDVWLHSPDKKQSTLHTLPASLTQLRQLAYGLLKEHRPFTEREWTGSGKLFSQDGFRDLRLKMEEYGYAFRLNPDDEHSAWELTDVGEQVMETWLEANISARLVAQAFASETSALPYRIR